MLTVHFFYFYIILNGDIDMIETKVALVTGASSGIGKETVFHLLKKGYIVYGVARRINKMEDIAKAGGFPIKMDITKAKDRKNVVEKIVNKHNRIDILVNNAGIGLLGFLLDVPIENARTLFEVNLFGLAHLTQLVIPIMRMKQFGKIINISSVAGKIYSPPISWYVASKHALEAWSDCLRIELVPFRIDVVIIEPGAIQTEFKNNAIPSENMYYNSIINVFLNSQKKNAS